MKWLQQQNKVEALSAASQQQGVQMSQTQQHLVQQVRSRLQQPGSLAWAFAAGTLFGATRGGNQDRDAFDLIRYLKGATLLWGLLSAHQAER